MSLRFAEIDGCAVPRAYYPVFRKLKAVSGCTYNSIDRSDAAAPILHRNGKSTQREVIRKHAEGVPGFGPANPVNTSSHCRRNDGVVEPRKAVAARLPAWQVGFDVNDDEVDDVIRAADELGWEVFQPYPGTAEFHHLNFRRKPARWKLLFHAVFGTWPGKKKPRGKAAISPAVPAPKAEPSPPQPKPKPKPKRDRLGDAIDVSEHQGVIDWSKVATAVKVVFIKATEGRTFTDGMFGKDRLDAMKRVGLRIGIYHFARPDNNPAAAEVAHFVDTVEKAGGRFISYADWRDGKPGVLAVLDFEKEPFSEAWARAWAVAFKKRTGVKPMLYGYGSSLNPILGSIEHFCGIWFAAYVDDWRQYLAANHKLVFFWQDRDDWRCPGVSGNVDHNRYLGRKR